VPAGRVTTYGTVARLVSGRPGGARSVGWALHALSGEAAEAVPWWRVINAQGRISTRCRSHDAAHQAARLRDEGVPVDDQGRVDLDRYGWYGPD
jgi:methylated-DNA-protein-cysteine methyltransferase-like protein